MVEWHKEKPKYSEEQLSMNFVHHKGYMERFGFDDDTISAAVKIYLSLTDFLLVWPLSTWPL